MVLDRRGVGKQAVDCHQGRNRGEKRKQAIEGHPGCDGQDAIFVHLLVDAPENVLPAPGGDLSR